MSETIGVSVCVFTYNYEKYLSQALDSVISQKTNFPIEIIIGDDCSKDGTQKIAAEYYKKHPDLFVLSFNEKNIGGTRNWVNSMKKCRGKYIALLDGDDYFTDDLKLQKQYDLLESNDKYVLCFHSVEERYDDAPEKNKIIEFEKEAYSLADFMQKGWFIRTGSTFFKNNIIPFEPPEWVYDYPYRYDTILHVFLCMHGDAFNIKEVMSVWRKHSKGMSLALMKNRILDFQQQISLANKLDEYTGFKYSKETGSFIAMAYTELFLMISKARAWFSYFGPFLKTLFRMNYFMLIKRVKGFLWK